MNPNCTDPTSLTVERLLAGLLLAAAVAVLGACHVPPPVVRSVLHITATGDVTLDGKAIAPAELQAALAARKAASTELEVEVRASAQADISRVQAVIASAKHAQVRVSFAREDGRP